VPSRDASLEKTERKRRWLDGCAAALSSNGHPARPTLLLGDLNILEPDHQPHYNFFAPFEYDFYRALGNRHGLLDAFRRLHPEAREYSWVGRTGDGYRYDHAFCSTALAPHLLACDYLHEPRATGLSDHSGLTVRLALQPPEALLTSHPASGPPTLF
jgi:exodeoxyribonuclease III